MLEKRKGIKRMPRVKVKDSVLRHYKTKDVSYHSLPIRLIVHDRSPLLMFHVMLWNFCYFEKMFEMDYFFVSILKVVGDIC